MSNTAVAALPFRRRVRKSVSRFTKRRLEAAQAWICRRSLVGTDEILPRGTFEWPEKLEANWTTIRHELEGVLTRQSALAAMNGISDTQSQLTSGDWKVFFLQAYGWKPEANRLRCPETVRLLDAIPDLEVAFFSVLQPGGHIPAHKGIYKGLIRAHLGLIVPEPRDKVRMRVGREMIVWEEGRCVVFDDTYQHEVWNETDGVRVVLLIDVRRPFPRALDVINGAILRIVRMTPFVKDSIRKHEAWEKTFYRTETRDGARP